MPPAAMPNVLLIILMLSTDEYVIRLLKSKSCRAENEQSYSVFKIHQLCQQFVFMLLSISTTAEWTWKIFVHEHNVKEDQ